MEKAFNMVKIDEATIVFKKCGSYKGKAAIFVNGNDFTYLIAKDLGYNVDKDFNIKCTWAYKRSYGHDIAERIVEFYGIDESNIQVFEVSF